ncbi:AAA family ATPase [Promicromonospora sp. NPDC050262]|uniref:helix-turn-helix transcriptional regulator n=1 Tax=Promicromonospora sp. NPDC050262 TaxID=3155036 RepID=UPI0033FDE74F
MSTSPIPSAPTVLLASGDRRLPLYGRQAECEALDQLVATVQAGRSAVLVLRGAAGIGKTVLLEYAHGSASGCRIARTTGVEAESELAFGGLHRLCAPFLDHLLRLPGPQRDALSTAFGLTSGDTPDRFLVGLAVLNLLAAAAEKGPLVCLVDDAQWLDEVSARTLAFVARRLPVAAVGLVLAVRDPHLRAELTELPEREVGRLSDGEARALLESVTPGRLDDRVRDRMVAETQGNPRALLVLPLGLTPAELAGGFGRPDVRPAAGDVEQSLLRRVRALPDPARRLLLTAAAEPMGDVTLLNRAADLLGLDLASAAPAVGAGLITLGTRVLFNHPLVRSATYQGASPQDRQDAHRALADSTDPVADPERRAWHLANALAGHDESVAAELERYAERVRARAGAAASAALLERATELTPDPGRRGTRALAAARAKLQAGGFDAALELLGAAELGPLDALGRARSGLLRGQVALASTSPGVALPLLVAVAEDLEPLDPALARTAYRDAFEAAVTAGDLPGGGRLAEVARSVLAVPAGSPPGRGDLLLDGAAVMATEGAAAGVPMVRLALDAFCAEAGSVEESLDWLPLACRVAHNAWEFDAWTTLSRRLVDAARETGTLSVLPTALHLLLSNRALAGELAVADTLLAEAVTVGEVTGSRFPAQYAALVLEPWRGREAATRRAIDAVAGNPALRGEGKVATATGWASAVLYNGLGRYEEAYAAAERGCEHPAPLGGPFNRSLTELVEAAARSGRPARAAEAARQLDVLARESDTDWALGVAASARAQVSEGADAEEAYRESVERLGRTEVRLMLARAHLLYGEWLRLGNRRVDAREQLGVAYEMLSEMGAEAFAERARRGLQAAGETVRRRLPQPHTVLTPQESHIARLAGEGLTNPQIGTQLFISPHTVEWHLRKVFQKLGIVSRKQLRGQLLDRAVATA